MIEQSSSDLRRIAHNLMPPDFSKTKLADILSGHINRLNNEQAGKFQLIVSGEDHQFNKQQELFIYRIILELTNNIIKHSKATEVGIQLLYFNTHLQLMAEDNGHGFNGEIQQGIGLRSIQSRISYSCGTLNIDSNEFGTTVIINIPYNQQSHE